MYIYMSSSIYYFTKGEWSDADEWAYRCLQSLTHSLLRLTS